MNCQTLQELEDHFNYKLESISTCMDLAAVASDPYSTGSDCKERLISINQELCDMEAILMDLRKSIKAKKEELQAAQELKEALDQLVLDVQHMEKNLPNHLQPAKNSPKTSEPRVPFQERHLQEDTYVLSQVLKPKQISFPRMDFIMQDEFTSVPKYMKGRISYEQLNSMVEVINETIRKKYLLMTKPKNQIGEKKMKTYMKYKEQETKDTKGYYFFTTEDLIKFCSIKNDGSVRNRLTMLRHCNRLKEIRGGGLTRYALLL